MPHVLYITFDGLLQPLGRSQVVRYCERLAARGWQFTILSLEREEDLADERRREALASQMRASDIEWVEMSYRSGGPRAAAANVADATAVAIELVLDRPAALVHARSYLGATVAAAVRATTGTPYLFDTRGYWVDEKHAEGQWFTNPAALAVGRAIERSLFAGCAGAVTLATPAAADISGGRFGRWSKPLSVIPTCVDEDEFTLAGANGAVPPDVVELLAERLVLGYVGSINASYLVKESFDVFARVSRLRPDAHLLCLTGQPAAMERALDEAAIPRSQRSVFRVPHEEMAQWMPLIDYGLLLLPERFAKRASMPTKLGEFLASGVRPVAHGCNADVPHWVRTAGSGFVVRKVDGEGLQEAAEWIAAIGKVAAKSSDLALNRARRVAMEHFGLDAGVARYEELYESISRS